MEQILIRVPSPLAVGALARVILSALDCSSKGVRPSFAFEGEGECEERELLRWLGLLQLGGTEGVGTEPEEGNTRVEKACLPEEGKESLVSYYRKIGVLPEALANYLLSLFWQYPGRKDRFSLVEVWPIFGEGKLREEPLKHDFSLLLAANSWWIKDLSSERIAKECEPYTSDYEGRLGGKGAAYWVSALDALKGQLSLLSGVQELLHLLFALELDIDQAIGQLNENQRADRTPVISTFFDLIQDTSLDLDKDRYTKEQFKKMVKTLKKKLKIDASLLESSLALCITGKNSYKELERLVPLLERNVLLERVRGVLNYLRS